MISKCKKLITDLRRDYMLEDKLNEYVDLLASRYNFYTVVKLSMNYYTMKEIVNDQNGEMTDVGRYFDILTRLIKEHVISGATVEEKSLEAITVLRSNVEYKMKNLTAFTDAYEIYEYILNRNEARIKNTLEDVDIDKLQTEMFSFVFSEKDPVVVNGRLQMLLSQLPIRMTKMKFYDIVNNTLSIYKGGEQSSVLDFVLMLRTAALIKKPDGFETEYPYLYHLYKDLCETCYADIDESRFDDLTDRLKIAVKLIENEVSAYLLMQEIINDVYVLLLTNKRARVVNIEQSGYKSAISILNACVSYESVDDIPEDLMTQFIGIEGVQESVYESVIILEAAFDDIYQNKLETIDKLGLKDDFKMLSRASKLLSTSLFIDLDKEAEDASLIADNDFIMSLRDELTDDLSKLFEGKERQVVRSIMSKLLSRMPIFMNSQQEIKDYFEHSLSNCKDKSELTACQRLVAEIMED